MLKSFRKLSLAVLALVLLLCVALLYFSSPGTPRLTLHYLSRTNDRTQTIVQFGITNIGNAAAISYVIGGIPAGRVQKMSGDEMGVYCYPTLRRLSPGQGDVIQVILPEGLQGRWRFVCNYARDGRWRRIDDWKRDAESYTKSFRARASRFLPSSLTKVRWDVTATSDWIEE
jgi:hypothetical protein